MVIGAGVVSTSNAATAATGGATSLVTVVPQPLASSQSRLAQPMSSPLGAAARARSLRQNIASEASNNVTSMVRDSGRVIRSRAYAGPARTANQR